VQQFQEEDKGNMMHKSHVAYKQQFAYTRGMTAALGGYIKTLRLRKGLSQAEVLRRLEIQFDQRADRTRLFRVERGDHWPESDFLTALLGIIGGHLDDLIWIRGHRDASELDGCALAEGWVYKYGTAADAEAVIQAQSRPDAEEIAEELEELAKKIRAGHG
jgi:transcriptional regulator with XRE-family HTH domain